LESAAKRGRMRSFVVRTICASRYADVHQRRKQI
jgi:hypothetical protein